MLRTIWKANDVVKHKNKDNYLHSTRARAYEFAKYKNNDE